MEKKVSEVFKIDNKWYQCIKSSDCQRCSFYNIVSKCSDKFPCVPTERHDAEEVIFKELEKVGEYTLDGKLYGQYQAYISPINRDDFEYVYPDNRILIKIKDNIDKEHEMEEIKKIKIPEGYVFDHENGSEIILMRKKNTISDLNDYTKCYSFMYDNGDIANVGMNTYIPRGTICVIDSLCQLLVCRNAWWEVLNWKPDWSNQEQKKYCIGYIKGKVDTTTNEGSNRILAFPSEEVRSDFFNTFYDLIEVSKELL